MFEAITNAPSRVRFKWACPLSSPCAASTVVIVVSPFARVWIVQKSRLLAEQSQITLKTEFEKRAAKAQEKQVRTAGYMQAAGSFVSAYGIGADAGYFDKAGGHIDSGSGGNIIAGGPGKIYSTTTYGTT